MPREKETAPWTAGPVRFRRVRGPDGEGRTYWRGTVDGRTVWSGWAHRLDSEVSAAALEAAKAVAVVPQPGPNGLPGDLMRHLLGAWKADQAERVGLEIAARSYELYSRDVAWLSAGLGRIPIDELTRDHVRDHVRARMSGRLRLPAHPSGRGKRATTAASSQTVHTELTRLEACWTWARKQRYVAHDLEIPWPKVTQTREKYTPTAGEIAAVMRELPSWARAMVLLLHATGARRSEIARLMWEQVDVERATVTLHQKTRSRVVPVGGAALAELRSRRPGAPGDRVLSEVTALTAEGLSEYLARACAAAGVARWTPHALRRYALDVLYESGADVGSVAKLLGQSPTTALKHYRAPRAAQLRRLVEAAGLGALPAGEAIPFPSQPVTAAGEKER